MVAARWRRPVAASGPDSAGGGGGRRAVVAGLGCASSAARRRRDPLLAPSPGACGRVVADVVAARAPEAAYLVRHPGVDMVSFTGSVETGARSRPRCSH